MKKVFLWLGMTLCVGILASGCAPAHFVRTMTPGWNTVEIREDLTYDQAWDSVVDLLAKEFDIEIVSKTDGYLRSAWVYTWTGTLEESYKVRAIVKFSPDHKKVEVKSEAQFYSGGFLGLGQGWVMGRDDRLMTTLRTDIMGRVGRVTR